MFVPHSWGTFVYHPWGTNIALANNYNSSNSRYLSNSCREDVEKWLNCWLSSHYLAVYIDATFIAARRDKQVSKEAYYTILGVLEDGSREVLSVVNHPSEGGCILKRRA